MRPVTLPAGLSLATSADGLAALHRPDCAAVVWSRAPEAGVLDWLAGLDPAQLPRMRMILRPDTAMAAATEAVHAAGTPDDPRRARLITDIAALATRFATLMAAPWLRLRLEVVTTNACRKFHRDAVTARLVCTYRGTGTQCATGAEGAGLYTVPTGAPVLLRGSLWPVTPDPGLLHRSPPIEGSGETRLLLVLDPIPDPEDEPDPIYTP